MRASLEIFPTRVGPAMVIALETSKGLNEEQEIILEVDGFRSKPLLLGWLVKSEMLTLEEGTSSSSTFWYVPCIDYQLVSLCLGCKCSKNSFQRF
jgi:hypothetical protein